IDDDDFNLLDLILAIFTWVIYIGQVGVWLATGLPGLITDVAVFPARLVHYSTVELPAWYLYLLSRRLLVATGFLVPKPEEVDPGLVTLGTSTGFFSLAGSL